MKKIIITIMAILAMMTLASCEKHEVSKGASLGSNVVTVTEWTIKDGVRIKDRSYEIVYETPEEAWASVQH